MFVIAIQYIPYGGDYTVYWNGRYWTSTQHAAVAYLTQEDAEAAIKGLRLSPGTDVRVTPWAAPPSGKLNA
jgi:hypothetical protein